MTLVSCGGGSNSTSIPSLGTIDPPTQINATASDGTVTVTWATAGDTVKNYQLYYKEDNNNAVGEYHSLNLVDQTDLTYIHTVTNGNQYTYKVSVVNSENLEGEKSNESETVSPIPTPDPPVFIETAADVTSTLLTWNNIQGLTYKIEYTIAGGSAIAIEGVATPFTHGNTTPLLNGNRYTYILTATNALNLKNSSQPVSLTPLAKPLKIKAVTAVAGKGQVTINWSRNPTQPLAQIDIYGVLSLKYKVYREEKNAQGQWINLQPLTEPPISTTTYIDTNVKTFTSYRYTVLQINNNNHESDIDPSVFAIATPTGTLAATSELLLAIEPTRLKFNWTAVTGATEYRLLFQPNGAGFTEIGQRIQAPTTFINIEIAVHLHQWDAQYILEACNADGCGASSNAVTTFTLSQMLSAIGYFKAFNTGTMDEFGNAVALSKDGNTLAIAALWEDSAVTGINKKPNDAGDNSGAVYVFIKESGQWKRQAFIKASNAESGDAFGSSISISDNGNTLVVGAAFEGSNAKGVTKGDYTLANSNNKELSSGAAYVFTRTQTGSVSAWTQNAYIKASNTGANDNFGESVSVSGDGQTVAVSARDNSNIKVIIPNNYDDTASPNNGAVQSGAVYVFERTPTAVKPWSQQAFVKPFNTGAGDLFGYALALNQSGTSLVVGARFEDSNTTGADPLSYVNQNNFATDSGAVYVFTRSAAVWTEKGYIKSLNTGVRDQFGFSVAISDDGNTIAAGAFFEDSSTSGINTTPNDSTTASDSGAVYVFTRSNAAWSQQAYIKSNNTGKGDYFGWSISLSGNGNALAVGAPKEDSGTLGVTTATVQSTKDSGATYIYTRNGTTWSYQSFVKALNTGVSDEFGGTVSLNFDGSKLLVGAHKESSATSIIDIVNKPPSGDSALSGAAYLY